MYRHIKKYEIKYSDADAFDRIKLSSLLSLMQESACLSADELGFGYSDIAPHNVGFILANCFIELNREVKLGDILEVHTWPLAPQHLVFLREFEFYIGGENVGASTTRWCMVNLNTFEFVPAFSHFAKDFFSGYNTERALDFNGWKISKIQSSESVYAKTVSFSDYDHYFHVNNAKYADMLIDAFSVEELRGRKIKSLQITYAKQCKYGENIRFFREEDAEGAYILEGRVDGELRVQARIVFDELRV